MNPASADLVLNARDAGKAGSGLTRMTKAGRQHQFIALQFVEDGPGFVEAT